MPDFDASPFKVRPQSKRITVGEGLPIRGRVVDHKGNPAVGAKVFLRDKSHITLRNGKPERTAVQRTVTDEDGRFAIDAAKGKATALIVSAPTCHVWQVPLTDAPGEVIIRLPEPATLELLYDIPGDAPQATIEIHLKSWDMPGWKRVASAMRTVAVPNNGRVVLNDMTPGLYDVWRSKVMSDGHLGFGAFCDRGDFALTAGKTTSAAYVRKEGHPVSGRITGLPADSVPGVMLLVQRAAKTKPPAAKTKQPAAGSAVRWITADALGCKPNGPFKTARLSPGTYTINAKAYALVSDSGRSFGLSWRVPAFTGSAKVTVEKDRPPAEVVIVMTKAE